MTATQSIAYYSVDPARLAHGSWCHRQGKTIGQGDISASYSADCIGLGQPVRKPFSWRGCLWLCVGTRYRDGVHTVEAYRLVHTSVFSGCATTYGEKLRIDNGDHARNDPDGFYHGMMVKHGRETLVLCGPAAEFIPGQIGQLSLF